MRNMTCSMETKTPDEAFAEGASLEDGLSGRLKESSYNYDEQPNYPERRRYAGAPSKKRGRDDATPAY
jgi:hypothetical protein